ncbi:MAG: hypothetical protein PHC51_06045 [bacterium]|nr:hypothetical protein [bacterium]
MKINAKKISHKRISSNKLIVTGLKQTRVIPALVLALATAACSISTEDVRDSAGLSSTDSAASTEALSALESFPHESFLASGTIVISRSLPKVSTTEVLAMRKEYGTLLGYVPLENSQTAATWLEYEKSSGLLKLFHEGDLLEELNTRGNLELPAGDYEVMNTAENPLWYASDAYFSSRHLPVPGQSDLSRYRSGALGNNAVFLNESVTIHSSVIWSSEVGGLQLPDQDLQGLLTYIAPGTPFIIKN